ncbi:cytochrome protein [Pseudovirgaria hyperparasitica]|uniref:Cytochrome protein n=1 Tax=Pseudovirgaria hyperparasitica TaxID=470096 RepID=A0A6A6W262_9PEZI|nr:cytochrome protein [Pseudovirgaria hyperparasitica]KAF2756982.1 cytochrome protein [Pseudovirgaria hyperparasitica]
MTTLTVFAILICAAQQRWHWMAALVAALVGELTYRYFKLNQFNGPFLAAITEWWHTPILMGLQADKHYVKLSKQYGDLVRIGPSHLLTSSPDFWIHANNTKTAYARSPWFYRAMRFNPGEDTVFSQCDIAKHDARRKQMAPGFSGKENLGLEVDIDGHVQELLQLIQSKYMSTAEISKPMDLAMKVQYLALDIISDIGLGQSFGDLKAEADNHDYIASGAIGLRITFMKIALGLTSFFDNYYVASLLGPSEKDKTGFGKVKGVARRIIDDRLEKPTDGKSDMVASFVRNGLTASDLFNESFNQILAGTDTTSCSIRVIMLYLMTNPSIYAKVRAEIDTAWPASEPGIIPDSIARNLIYLQAVVREAMRMHPPVSDLFTREVPNGGDTFTFPSGKEVYFPGGTRISYSIAMHTDPEHYGADAHVFRPERWLTQNTPREKLARMQKINDLIFGYGKFHCLGQRIAFIEINKTIVELVRRFDISLVDPLQPWKSACYGGIYVQGDMWVQVRERGS